MSRDPIRRSLSRPKPLLQKQSRSRALLQKHARKTKTPRNAGRFRVTEPRPYILGFAVLVRIISYRYSSTIAQTMETTKPMTPLLMPNAPAM